ncbi:hypothetical protein [Halalkalibacter oceani]|uniref:hypothetical protein n=1 Tax=Halalkalibacter oceani TaxID=1653776 RepID=UPI0033986F5A
MQMWKKDVAIMLEVLLFIIIGFFLTLDVYKKILESFGILFMGNTWINWFGLSYFLFVLYSIAAFFITQKKNSYFEGRMKSFLFWLLFTCSIYIVFIPFLKGQNPF